MTETITPPQAPTPGNLLVIGFVASSPPDLLEGWNAISSVSVGPLGYYAFSLVAGAAEPAAYAWTFAAAPAGAFLYMELSPTNPAVIVAQSGGAL